MAPLNSEKTAPAVRIYAFALAAVALAAGILTAFMPSLDAAQARLNAARNELAQHRALLARKSALDEKWQSQKTAFQPELDGEELVSGWVRELLAAAQAQSLSLERLEPGGERRLVLAFKSDIGGFVRFLRTLAERDPRAKIESFSIRREEIGSQMLFELTFSKAAL